MKFYKSVVEWMVKDNSEIAGCIHALARNRARENMKMKSYQQAAAELCFALHLWKEDPRTYRLLAQVLIQLQDERKAIIALHEVLRLVPDDLSLRKRIANYGIRTGNIDIAITQFREILARNPQEMESRLSLGKILFSEEKYAEIPEILLPYQEQYPDHIECNRLLGITRVPGRVERYWLPAENFEFHGIGYSGIFLSVTRSESFIYPKKLSAFWRRDCIAIPIPAYCIFLWGRFIRSVEIGIRRNSICVRHWILPKKAPRFWLPWAKYRSH